MRDTRMRGDVNSRQYVRSVPEKEEKEEEEERRKKTKMQTTLEDINHPMATLSRARISDIQYTRAYVDIYL